MVSHVATGSFFDLTLFPPDKYKIRAQGAQLKRKDFNVFALKVGRVQDVEDNNLAVAVFKSNTHCGTYAINVKARNSNINIASDALINVEFGTVSYIPHPKRQKIAARDSDSDENNATQFAPLPFQPDQTQPHEEAVPINPQFYMTPDLASMFDQQFSTFPEFDAMVTSCSFPTTLPPDPVVVSTLQESTSFQPAIPNNVAQEQGNSQVQSQDIQRWHATLIRTGLLSQIVDCGLTLFASPGDIKQAERLCTHLPTLTQEIQKIVGASVRTIVDKCMQQIATKMKTETAKSARFQLRAAVALSTNELSELDQMFFWLGNALVTSPDSDYETVLNILWPHLGQTGRVVDNHLELLYIVCDWCKLHGVSLANQMGDAELIIVTIMKWHLKNPTFGSNFAM